MLTTVLTRLKTHGYTPNTIFDIGAHHGNWTKECMKTYPSSNYYLFEAIPYDELIQFNSVRNVKTFINVLDSTERQVDWYEMKNTGDSMYKELTHHFENCIPTKRITTTLDTVCSSYMKSINNVFLKIDCQGAELPILKGAKNILTKTDFVLLEMPFFGQYNAGVPSFIEHITYMDSIGFIPYDICEHHKINDFLMQIDILFINKNHEFNSLVQKKLMIH